MTIPDAFGRDRERIIASFDAIDVASGLGFQTFYGARSNESGNQDYILTDRIIYSADIVTSRAGVGTTTMEFETTAFNKAKTVKGTAIFSCGTGSTAGNQQVKAQLFNVVPGVSSTPISDEITSTSVTGGTDHMHLLELPLTQAIIKRGNTIKLVVKFITFGGSSAEIGHDPRGRNGTFIGVIGSAIATTVMQLDLPFRIPL